MKNLSKKILSILTAVALLFSFAVPAGALTVGANGDPLVTKIDFDLQADGKTSTYNTGTKEWNYVFGYVAAGAGTEESPYVLSFDYYMPNASTVKVAGFGSANNGTLIGAASNVLEQGYHTFTGSFTAPSEQFYPRLTIYAPHLLTDANDVIYIWNVSVTKGGVARTFTDLAQSNVHTSSKPLSEWEWAQNTLTVSTLPTKTAYTWGQPLDTTGMVVTLSSVLGSETIDAADCTVSGYDASVIGEQTVTVTYRDHTVTFTVTVTEPVIIGITVSSQPTKTTYELGESLDTTGLAIAYLYDNDAIQAIDANKITVTGFVPTQGGTQFITVTYGEYITVFPVTVNDPPVTMIDFGTKNPSYTGSSDPACYAFVYHTGNADASAPFVVRFEYYLPAGSGTVSVTEASGACTKISGSNTTLLPGHNVFEAEYTGSSSIFVPRLSCSAMDADIYIWNVSTTKNGNALSNNDAGLATYQRAAATDMGGLSTQNWYATMDIPTVTKIDFDKQTDGTPTYVDEENTKYWRYCFGTHMQGVATVDQPYVLSFDYYMPNENNVGAIFFTDQDGSLNFGNMSYYGNSSRGANICKPYEFYQEITYAEKDENDNYTTIASVGDLFVCLPEGMSPTDYADIEISTNNACVDVSYANVTVDNLNLKYAAFGVTASALGGAKNLTVTNCEIGYIGGAMSGTADSNVRYGNGIEVYGVCDGVTVTGNWIYQCYDAGYTNQGNSGIQQNIRVTNNLIEYCNYSIEVWMNGANGLIMNADYSDNMMRFAGYQFERHSRSTEATSHLCFMRAAQPCVNVTITGNILDTSYRALASVAYPNSDLAARGPKKGTGDITYNEETEKYYDEAGNLVDEQGNLLDAEGNVILYPNEYSGTNTTSGEVVKRGPTIEGNTWIQGYDRHSIVAYMRDMYDSNYEVQETTANNLAELRERVNDLDSAPTDVKFEK